MKGIIGRFISRPKLLAGALLAPAQDPRKLYAEALERQQGLLAELRRARGRVGCSIQRLEANLVQVRDRLILLKGQAGKTKASGHAGMARLAEQVMQGATEELAEMEAHARVLACEEQALALAEQRLEAQIAASAASREAAALRHNAEETRAQVRQALESVLEEMAGPDGGVAKMRDPLARRLASRFASLGRERREESFQRRLGLGLTALQDLGREYERLLGVLEKLGEGGLLFSSLPALAEETYHRALGALEHALEVMVAGHTPGQDKLEAGIEQYIDELLHQVARCHACLHKTLIEAVAIRAGDPPARIDQVIEMLHRAMNQAKEVEEEIRSIEADGPAWKPDGKGRDRNV